MITCKACGHESGYDFDRGDVNPDEKFYQIMGPVLGRQSGRWGDERKFDIYVCPKCGTVSAEKEF